MIKRLNGNADFAEYRIQWYQMFSTNPLFLSSHSAWSHRQSSAPGGDIPAVLAGLVAVGNRVARMKNKPAAAACLLPLYRT